MYAEKNMYEWMPEWALLLCWQAYVGTIPSMFPKAFLHTSNTAPEVHLGSSEGKKIRGFFPWGGGLNWLAALPLQASLFLCVDAVLPTTLAFDITWALPAGRIYVGPFPAAVPAASVQNATQRPGSMVVTFLQAWKTLQLVLAVVKT